MISIYKIQDEEGKIYIGKSQSPVKRFAHHKCVGLAKMSNIITPRSALDSCRSSLLDWNTAKLSIIETCDKEDSIDREAYHINNTDCVNLYNKTSLKQTEIDILEQVALVDPENITEIHRLKKILYNKRSYELRKKKPNNYYNNCKDYVNRRRKFRYYCMQDRLSTLEEKYPEIYTEFIHLQNFYKP